MISAVNQFAFGVLSQLISDSELHSDSDKGSKIFYTLADVICEWTPIRLKLKRSFSEILRREQAVPDVPALQPAEGDDQGGDAPPGLHGAQARVKGAATLRKEGGIHSIDVAHPVNRI